MFQSLMRLSTNLSQVHVEPSLFSYLRKAGTELAPTSVPSDLESLVRIVSAINSFKYPAFTPTLKRIVLKDGDPKWLAQLSDEALACPQTKALKFLRGLSSSDMPAQLISNLLQRMSVNSKQDVAEFISAVEAMNPLHITADVRRALQYVLRSAINNKCPMSTYNSIFELNRNYWSVTHKHLLPTKLRDELVAASWMSMLRLDMSKEADFVAGLQWLCFKERVTGQKEEIESMLARMELRANEAISQSSIVAIVKSVISMNESVIPEPVDSISQILMRRINVPKLSLNDLVELSEGINSFFEHTGQRSVQVDAMVSTLIPSVVELIQKRIPSIPSRSLPSVLRLLTHAGMDASATVAAELSQRGFELDGVELVKLVNSVDGMPAKLLEQLFTVKLAEVGYLNGLLANLTLKDRIELLATFASAGVDLAGENITVLTQSLRDSIRADLVEIGSAQSSLFETETIVKLCAAGDAAFEAAGLVPSRILTEFLQSDRSGSLTVDQTLTLLRACADGEVARSLFAHALASPTDLTAMEGLELLRAAVSTINDPALVNTALKLIVPKIDSQVVDMDVFLSQLPVLPTGRQSRYAPTNQLRDVSLAQLENQVGKMDFTRALRCLSEMSRLDYQSGTAISAVLARLTAADPGASLGSPQDAVVAVQACRKLKTYNGPLFDQISHLFLDSLTKQDAGSVDDFAKALVAVGNKNDAVVQAVEKVLRDIGVGSADTLPIRISLLNSLAKAGVFSPLFQEGLRAVIDETQTNLSSLTEQDWVRLFEANLAIVIEAPPKIKTKYVNDLKFKAFFDDHCSFSWYAAQERLRTDFLYSTAREEIAEAIQSLGWTDMRTPELGQEVYHIDFASGGKVAIVTIPESDELAWTGENAMRIIVGDSMTKVKHLQMLGYKVVPVWLSEWSRMASAEARRNCLLRNSTQLVFALGAGRAR